MVLNTFFNLFDCCSPATTRRQRREPNRRSTIHKEGVVASSGDSTSRPPPRLNNTANPAVQTLVVPEQNKSSQQQQHGDNVSQAGGDAGNKNNKSGTYGLLIVGLNISPDSARSGLFGMLESYKPLYNDCDFKHINTHFMLRSDSTLEQYATTTHALLIAWNMDTGLLHTQEAINTFLRQYFHKPVPIILYAETKQQPPTTTPSMTQIQDSNNAQNMPTLHAPTSTVGGFSYNNSAQLESNAQLQQQQKQEEFRSAPLEDRVHALIDSLVVGTCLQAHKHVTTVVVFDVDMLNEKRLRKCMQWASKQARKTFGHVDVMADAAAAALNNRTSSQRGSVPSQKPSEITKSVGGALLQPVDIRQSTEQQRSPSLFRAPPLPSPQQSSNPATATLSSQSSSTQTQYDANQQQQQQRRSSATEHTQTPLNSNVQLPARFPPPLASSRAPSVQNSATYNNNNSILSVNPTISRTRSNLSSNVVLALTVPKITDSQVVQRATAESRRQLMQNINTIQRNFRTVLEWAVSEESLNTGVVKELVAIVRGEELDASGQLEEFPVTLRLEQPTALEFVINVLNGLYTEKNLRH